VVQLDDTGRQPIVSGLIVKVDGRQMFVSIHRIERLEGGATASITKPKWGVFERRPGEALLNSEVIGRRMIHVDAARFIIARDVELRCSDGIWHVTAIDPSVRAKLRHTLPRALRGNASADRLIAWHELEPLLGHVPGLTSPRLHPRLAVMEPAQIAQLVQAASYAERTEILEAVGQEVDLGADVYEQLDRGQLLEYLHERSDFDVADVLTGMSSDDAASLLAELDGERWIAILDFVPAAAQRKIMALLGLNSATAGGLMNPLFPVAYAEETAADALVRVQRSNIPSEQLLTICVIDSDGVLVGAVSLAELVRGGRDQTVANLVGARVPTVQLDTDLAAVTRLLNGYSMTAIPVVDDAGRPVGVIAVEEVMTLLLPEKRRRRSRPSRS